MHRRSLSTSAPVDRVVASSSIDEGVPIALIGGVVGGGVALIAIIVIVIVYLVRRQKKSTNEAPVAISQEQSQYGTVSAEMPTYGESSLHTNDAAYGRTSLIME